MGVDNRVVQLVTFPTVGAPEGFEPSTSRVGNTVLCPLSSELRGHGSEDPCCFPQQGSFFTGNVKKPVRRLAVASGM